MKKGDMVQFVIGESNRQYEVASDVYLLSGLEVVNLKDYSGEVWIKYLKPSKPFKTITLCGSTKFKQQFEEANARLTMEGNVVISVGVFGHANQVEFSEGQKEQLDKIHLQKIDMADEIFVINVCGYIGESTRREIKYAQEKGIPVKYLEELAEWNYKMFINDIYWKGYGGEPTLQQKEVERSSFRRSEYYAGGSLEVAVVKKEEFR